MYTIYKRFLYIAFAPFFPLITTAQTSDSTKAQPNALVPVYHQKSQSNSFLHYALIPAVADDPLAPLQGQVPGMMMLKSGGDPLQPFSIRLLVISSLYGSNKPQGWLDGFPAYD